MYRCVQVPVNLGGLNADGVVLVQVGWFWLHPCSCSSNLLDNLTVESFKFEGGGNFLWIVLIHEDVISWMLWFSVSVRKLALS